MVDSHVLYTRCFRKAIVKARVIHVARDRAGEIVSHNHKTLNETSIYYQKLKENSVKHSCLADLGVI